MYAQVSISSLKLDRLLYSYEDKNIEPGSLVKVELKRKELLGIVTGIQNSTELKKVKPVLELIEKGFIPLSLLELIRWVSRYYIAPLGQTLHLTIPKKVYVYRPKKVLPRPYEKSESFKEAPRLNLKEHRAVKDIISSLRRKVFKTFLLLDSFREIRVEVYLRLIEEALRLKKGTIVLLPEIALTPIVASRFGQRFGKDLVVLHSGLKESERRGYWRMIREGRFKVVLGVRSTIFAPIRELGLIIVEEEEDPSYKETRRAPHYNARDVAVMRGNLERVVVVLGSSNPSLESFYNARKGRYRLLNIYSPPLSKPRIVDMRKKKSIIISDYLSTEIKKRINQGGVLLFLNQRGFSKFLSCRDCGWISKCPYCGIPLTYVKGSRILECRFCRYKESGFDSCPNCDSHNFIYQGLGIEKVIEELRKIRTDISVIKLERESFPEEEELNRLLFDFSRGKIKILVGTRMIIKKLESSTLPLVGVISSDTLLNLPDFRAPEVTFRLLSQLSMLGRRTILQTRHPDNYVIGFIRTQNLFGFYNYELKERKTLFYPPFSRLVIIKALSTEKELAENILLKLKSKLSSIPGIRILGPTTPFHLKKREKFIYQLLMKLERERPFHTFIKRDDFLQMDIDIDVDPIEMI